MAKEFVCFSNKKITQIDDEDEHVNGDEKETVYVFINLQTLLPKFYPHHLPASVKDWTNCFRVQSGQFTYQETNTKKSIEKKQKKVSHCFDTQHTKYKKKHKFNLLLLIYFFLCQMTVKFQLQFDKKHFYLSLHLFL